MNPQLNLLLKKEVDSIANASSFNFNMVSDLEKKIYAIIKNDDREKKVNSSNKELNKNYNEDIMIGKTESLPVTSLANKSDSWHLLIQYNKYQEELEKNKLKEQMLLTKKILRSDLQRQITEKIEKKKLDVIKDLEYKKILAEKSHELQLKEEEKISEKKRKVEQEKQMRNLQLIRILNRDKKSKTKE